MGDPQQVSAAWLALGRQLAGWRQSAGYTQEELAPLVRYARSSIANIETGKQRADRPFWERADALLGADGALLTGYDDAEALRRRERRPVITTVPVAPPAGRGVDLGGAGEPGATGCLDALEDPGTVDSRRRWLTVSNVDDAKLGLVDEAIQRLIADNERQPPAALVPHVRQLRGYVEQLLSGRQHPSQRGRLYAQGAHLSGLLGALALDLSVFPAARAYAAEAFELAEVVGEPDLQAWARALQSVVAYYAGDFRGALGFARDGVRRSPRGPHGIRLAVTGEARALARLGDRGGVDEAVERAFGLLEWVPDQPSLSAGLTTGPYCRTRTAVNAATAYLAIGASARVPGFVAPARPADGTGLAAGQELSRWDAATAALRQDNPEADRASGLAIEAMMITSERRSEAAYQRARQFAGVARRWASQVSVREVAALVVDRSHRPVVIGTALPSH